MVKRHKLTQQEIDRFYLWLNDYPGYKRLIRERISNKQKEIRKQDSIIAARQQAMMTRYRRDGLKRKHQHPKGVDHDNLGREVEGCG